MDKVLAFAVLLILGALFLQNQHQHDQILNQLEFTPSSECVCGGLDLESQKAAVEELIFSDRPSPGNIVTNP